MTSLGDTLKELRGNATLYEVGLEIGVDRSIISRYERGVIAPKPPLLKKLAQYYEVDYKWLRSLYYDDTIKAPEEHCILLTWAANKLRYPQEFMDLIDQLPNLPADKQRTLLAEILSKIEKKNS